MRRRPGLALILTCLMALPQGCITVESHDDAAIGKDDLRPVRHRQLTTSELDVSHFLYASPHGRSGALQKVLDRGIVPVYVVVRNTGPLPVAIDQDMFELRDDRGALAALSPDELARDFESFNGKALVANVTNVTLIVGGIFLIALALGKGGSGGCCGANWLGGGFDEDEEETPPSSQYVVINPIMKTTTIHYRDLLIPPDALRPGESAEGLIFFRAPGRKPHWQKLHLGLR